MTPPAGAGPWSVAAPVKEIGVVRFVLNVIDLSVGASTLRIADCVSPPAVAPIVTATACEVGVQRGIRNGADVAPAGTVTAVGAGTTAGKLLANCTSLPVAGAGALRVTCPVMSRSQSVVGAESVTAEGVCASAVIGAIGAIRRAVTRSTAHRDDRQLARRSSWSAMVRRELGGGIGEDRNTSL